MAYNQNQRRGGNHHQGGNHQGSNYQGGNHQGSNYQGGNHQGGNHQGGNHQGGNHQGGNYQGCNHQGSNYQGSNHQGSNYQGSNHQGSNYQGGNQSRPPYNYSNTRNPMHNPNQQQSYESKPQESRPPIHETKSGISIAGNILAKISFCDKQCSNINDNKVKSQIVKHLEAQYGIPIISRDFTVINPNNLRIVSFHQHLLTPLTNGNPYLLLLIRIDGINCCIYIDRKLKDGYTYPKMHCVKYNFHEELFENETVFSGELVKDTERRWVFLLDGILLYKGMTTTEKNVIGRYELIHSIMANEYTRDAFLEICPLQVKRLFLYRDVEKMVQDFIPNLSYTCKGILFYTLNNRCSNFAFLLPRDAQFEIKTHDEIDDIVQTKYPKLWAKKHDINQEQIPDALSINPIEQQGGITAVATPAMISTDCKAKVEIAVDNVVFKILKTDIPDIYNLYCIESSTTNLVKYGIALVPNIRISHYLYNGFKGDANNLDRLVECRFSKIFEKWTPIRFVANELYNKGEIEKIEDKMKESNKGT